MSKIPFRAFSSARLLSPALAAVLAALSVAGCASAPPPQAVASPDPPPRKPLDAKTQLETGRRF